MVPPLPETAPMIQSLIFANIAREANRQYIAALHSQMQGYNARLAPKADKNADLVAAYSGKITVCKPARRPRKSR